MELLKWNTNTVYILYNTNFNSQTRVYINNITMIDIYQHLWYRRALIVILI